jgi:hypothetical protein
MSIDKTDIFRWGAYFCEEAIWLVAPKKRWPYSVSEAEFWKAPRSDIDLLSREAQSLKVDFPKMRLLSVERKIGIGTSDEDVNPALGKFT